MKRIYYGIFLLSATLFPLWSASAAALSGGELYMTPESDLRTIGEPFDVRVYANTNGQAVNAIEGELVYNPSDLSVEAISIDHSVLASWSTVPSYDSAAGIVRFSGWAAQPFIGSEGLLITITFRPLRVGQSSVDFNSGSMLASNERGSNIITSMRSSVFRVQPIQTQPPAPVVPLVASTTIQSTTTDTQTPATPPPTQVPPAPERSNAAALALSGVELAPFLIPFLAILALIAFGIAYVLHRFTR